MTNKSATTAPPIGIVPEVAKSDFDVSGGGSGSETEVHKSGLRGREREGVTFDTAGLQSHYTPIDRYEGKHRYDPDFDWEPEEERRVVRKVRLYIPLSKKAKLTKRPRLTSVSVPGSV